MALVFAMVGGAFAATDSNSGDGATASGKKGKKGPRGPKGPAGPQGPAGPAGAKGDAGAAGNNGNDGAAGKDGATGKDGAAGKDGQSVAGAPIAAGGACGPVTGVKYTLDATSTDVCNGEPWTAGGTLPSGETETGVWAATDAFQIVTASFNIPLTSAPTIEYKPEGFEGEPADNCPGEASAPAAKKGFACFYTILNEEIVYKAEFGFPQTFPSGAALLFTGPGIAFGTWAVTAP